MEVSARRWTIVRGALIAVILLGGALLATGRATPTHAQPVYPGPVTITIQTPLGTITITCTDCAPGTTLIVVIVNVARDLPAEHNPHYLSFDQAASQVTLKITASNGAASAGKHLQGCLATACQSATLDNAGSAMMTFNAPNTVVPGGAPSTGLGGGQPQQPQRAVAAAVSGAPAAQPSGALPALPNTGTGGVRSHGSSASQTLLIGSLAMVLVLASGLGVVVKRRGSR